MTNTDSAPLKRSHSTPLRLGIAGLGTVGVGVIRLLRAHAELITQRTGRSLEVVAVSARNRQRDRGEDLSAFRWHEDPIALASDPEVDVVVELIGGANNPARKLVTTALENGKAVVTANKALIALHGDHLARLSAEHNAPLYYEAAVAGVVPAVKVVREALAGDQLTQLGGIMNGTCNFILSEMEETGRAFGDVLKEAQEKGFAEADPSTDVDGWDTAHKLAILTGIAFQPIDFESLEVRGIRGVTSPDIAYTKELGYRIKLLGVAHRTHDGGVDASVQPCLVPLNSGLAQVGGAFNALTTVGTFSGAVTLSGQGAGEGPTATAVMADLIDLGRGHHLPLWGQKPPEKAALCVPSETVEGAYYLRLPLADNVTEESINALLDEHKVPLKQASLRKTDDGSLHFVSVTHPILAGTLHDALYALGRHKSLSAAPLALKIEDMP